MASFSDLQMALRYAKRKKYVIWTSGGLYHVIPRVMTPSHGTVIEDFNHEH